MEVPVCLEKRRVGTMRVEPSGADTVFRVCCTGLPAGLYRLYACGGGRVRRHRWPCRGRRTRPFR